MTDTHPANFCIIGFLVISASLNVIAADTSPNTKTFWAFMDREGNAACVPLSILDKQFGKPMTLDEVMAQYSPQGYKKLPFPLRGTTETVEIFEANNQSAPLMSKASCEKLSAWARVKMVPEHVWTQGDGKKR